MNKFLLSTFVAILIFNAKAQQVVPVLNLKRTLESEKLLSVHIDSLERLKADLNEKVLMLDQKVKLIESVEIKNALDAVIRETQEEIEVIQSEIKKEYQKLYDVKDDHFFIYGNGSIDALSFDNLTAMTSLNFKLIPRKNVAVNCAANFGKNLTSEKADSVLVHTFFLPDIGRTSGLINLEVGLFGIQNGMVWGFRDDTTKLKHKINKDRKVLYSNTMKNQLFLNLEASVQNRYISLDSNDYNLNITNYGIGINYRFIHFSKEKSDVAIFNLGVSCNGTRINLNSQESFRNYILETSSVNEVPKPSFLGFGLQTSLTCNETTFYFRSYRNLRNMDYYNFTIGVKLNGILKSF